MLVDLALGGSSHGAFTWGVLDRTAKALAEDRGDLRASAGAMNAAVLVSRICEGQPPARRSARRVLGPGHASAAAYSPIRGRCSIGRSTDDARHVAGLHRDGSDEPAGVALHTLDPFGSQSDPQDSRGQHRLRTFRRDSPIGSSSRRPASHRSRPGVPVAKSRRKFSWRLFAFANLFQAIEIDGEPHWDGGYAAIRRSRRSFASEARDTILVQINPARASRDPHCQRHSQPTERDLVQCAVDEELRMIALLRRAADPGDGGAALGAMRTHRIMTDSLADFGASSSRSSIAERAFLSGSEGRGRRVADDFLRSMDRFIGVRSPPISTFFFPSADHEWFRNHRPARHSGPARRPDLVCVP